MPDSEPNSTTPIEEPKKRNGFAIAGLSLGIAGVFLYEFGTIPILAIIVSSIGLSKVKSYQGIGKIHSWIGLILGIIYTLVFMAFVFMPSHGLLPIRAGKQPGPLQTTPPIYRTTPEPPTPVNANKFIQGNQLVQCMKGFDALLQSQSSGSATNPLDSVDSTFFFGFVMGVCDAHSLPLKQEISSGEQVCAAVSTYLKRHPEKWHLSAEELVVTAAREAFPK